MINQIFFISSAYLIGSLSFGIIVSKFFNLSDPRTIGSKNKNVYSLEFTVYNNENKDIIIKRVKYRSIQECVEDNEELKLNRHNIYRIAKNVYKKNNYNNLGVVMINNQPTKEEKLRTLEKKMEKIQAKIAKCQ